MCRTLSTLTLLVFALASSEFVQAQKVEDDSSSPLITRFYDITLLKSPQKQFPFEDQKGSSSVTSSTVVGGASGGGFGGGGMGGMGGGMGGMGGGGGYFNVPIEPTQFGGGSPSTQAVESSFNDELIAAGESLSDLIMQQIASDSWDCSGSGSGTVTEVGNTLIVRQTEVNHKSVAEFLRTLTSTVVGTGIFELEAWWIPAVDGEPSELKSLLESDLTDAAKQARLNTLVAGEGCYYGTLRCQDRVTTHMASGQRVPVIAGSTPVVGTGAIGHSPSVRLLHLGLMLEARVAAVPRHLVAADDSGKQEHVDITFRSTVTEPDAEIEQRATFEKVDRYLVREHQAAGMSRLKVGQPTLISSLSQVSKQDDDRSEVPPALQLVICVIRAAE